MRVIVQRVLQSSVSIDNKVHNAIEQGILLLLGIENNDSTEDINWLIQKVINLRIFNDDQGRMNISIKDMGGSILVISQFTLYASTKKGNRPSYIAAAKPGIAIPLYEDFVDRLSLEIGVDQVKTGIFGADMKISLINDGPVTIIMDSKNKDF